MLPGGCVYNTGSNHDPRRCWEGGHFDNDCRGNPRSVSCSDGPNGETFVRTLTDPNADAWGSADYTCTNPSVPEGTVSRAIIAGIWVAFFQRVPAIIVRTGADLHKHRPARGLRRWNPK